MRNEAIPCGPQLTGFLMNQSGIMLDGFNFELSTRINGEDVFIDKHGEIYTDEYESWSPEHFPLMIFGRVIVRDMRKLKGPGGIAAKNAELRVAVSWSSVSRDIVTGSFRMQGIIEPDEERSTPDGRGKIYVFRHTFPPASIRGNLVLSPFIYIENPDPSPSDDDMIFVNKQGYRFVPSIRTCEYQFTKDATQFPIREVHEKGEKLWWIDIRQMDDPTKDPFEEYYVRISLNTAFPGFETLVKKNGRKAFLMLHIDILATAYYLLIEYLRSHEKQAEFWPQISTGEGLEPNSVAGVVSLFVRIAGINVNEKKGSELYKQICGAMMKQLG